MTDPDDLEAQTARFLNDDLEARTAAFRTGADPDEEEQGPLSRAMRFLGQGATQAAIAGSRLNPLTHLVAPLREQRETVEARHEELKREPEGALENISYYTGRLAPELLSSGGAVKAAGQLGLRGISRALVGNIPSSATFAADKESSLVQSDNPLARFAGEYAANLAGEGVFAGAGRVLRNLRKPSETIAENVDNLTEGLRGRTAPGAREILEKEVGQQRVALNVAEQADVNPDDYMKIEKFGLPSDEANDRLRGAMRQGVSELRAKGLDPREPISNKQTIAEAMGLSIDEIMETAPNRLNRAELTGIRIFVNNTSAEMDELTKEAAALQTGQEFWPAGTGEARLRGVEEQIQSRWDEVVQALKPFTIGRSEAGRNLQALKSIARQSREPFTWYYHAQQQLGDAPFTDEMRANISTYLRENRLSELSDYVAGFRKASGAEKLTNWFRANILTATITPLTNFTGNTTKQLFHSVEDPAALFWDRAIKAALGTGIDTRAPSFRSAVAAPIAQGTRVAAKRGRSFLKDILHPLRAPGPQGGLRAPLRGQFDEIPALADIAGADDLAKFDQFQRVRYNNAFMDAYTNFVHRTLSDPDAVASQMSAVRSLEEQARILAKRGLGQGETVAERVRYLRQNPTDEMALRAISDSAYDTFRVETQFGSGLMKLRGAVSDISGSLVGRGPGEFIGGTTVPFTRTIGALGEQAVKDYTPLGALRSIGDIRELARQAAKGEPDEELQLKVVNALARSTSGTLGPLLIGAYLMHKGLMTGPAPRNPTEREMFYAEGKIPFAVKFRGEWRSVERVSPYGNVLIAGGGVMQSLTDPELSGSQKIGQSAQSAASMILQSPLLTGTNQLMETATGERPHGMASRAGALAGNMLPFSSALRATARGVDPTIREKETFTDELRAGIPFLSKSLPARVGPLGDDAVRPQGLGGQMFDIFRSSPDKLESDDLLRAMNAAGIRIGGRDRREGESPEAYESRQRREGRELRANLELLESYMTADISPEMRRTIENAIQAYRSRQSEQAKYMEMVQ